VLASIANYMASNGWVYGESWGRRVKLPPDFDARLGQQGAAAHRRLPRVRQLTEPMLLSEWRAVGVRTAKGAPLPKARWPRSLLRVDQETFLVYRNYETLLTYNCAHSYATAVGLLADRLDGRLESWPAAKKTAKPARALHPVRIVEGHGDLGVLARLHALRRTPRAIPWRLTGVPGGGGPSRL
jgi:hypothetical protein